MAMAVAAATRTTNNTNRKRQRQPLVLLPAAILISIIFAAAILLQDGLGVSVIVQAEVSSLDTTAATKNANSNRAAPPPNTLSSDTIDHVNGEDNFDEDLLAKEIIEASRGSRDAPGVRDQWKSNDHLNVAFDSRKPVSEKVKRLLEAYGLTCENCDHDEAVKKVNARVRAEKMEREERERKRGVWKQIGTVVVVLLSVGYYFYKEKIHETVVQVLGDSEGNDDERRAEFVRRRREEASRAANQRLQEQSSTQQQNNPTWLDNEKKERWTPKQEQQFQKALREFGGVSKKERYVLIAEKVDGKSRIECLTHHKMQGLLAKHEEEMRRQEANQQ